MVLCCSACGAEPELGEEHLADLDVDLEGRLCCPECGVFAARVLQTTRGVGAESAVPPLQDLGSQVDGGWAGRPLRLRRGSREYRVQSLDRLRRLVVERKALPSDLVSADGVGWVPLDSVPALQPFLAVVRFLDSGPTTGGGGVLVEASAAEDGWGERGLGHGSEGMVAGDEPDGIQHGSSTVSTRVSS